MQIKKNESLENRTGKILEDQTDLCRPEKQ